jgi:hypothetical protein
VWPAIDASLARAVSGPFVVIAVPIMLSLAPPAAAGHSGAAPLPLGSRLGGRLLAAQAMAHGGGGFWDIAAGKLGCLTLRQGMRLPQK